MDVVLGAAVTGPIARLALVDGSATERRDVIDQSTIDVESDPARKLAVAIVGTQRSLIADGHRLAATRVCWSDHRGLQQLRQTLSAAGISDVTSVLESDAAVAMVRDITRVAGTASSNGFGHAALLFCDDDTATLSIVGADDATTTVLAAEPVEGSDPVAACRTLLSRLSEEPGETRNLFLMSTSPNIAEVAKQIRTESPVPLVIPDDTDLALAHGATLAGGTAPSTDGIWTETALNTMGAEATALSPQIGPQLAYSAVDDSGSLPPLGNAGSYDVGDIPIQSRMSPLSQADDDDEEDDTVATGAAAVRPRYLLLGSAVAAAVVVAFAALAVTVAAGIRPTPTQVALAQPQSHPMPTFLPLPTNVVAPPPLNPEAIPVGNTGPSVPGVGGGQLPGGSGPFATGPVELPQGDPSPEGIPDGAPSPQIPSGGMPGGPQIPLIIPVPIPIWVMNPNGQLVLRNPNTISKLPGSTNGTLPGGTNGTLPGGTNGTLPGGTNGTLPGGTNGTLPGGTNGTLPGGTNGTLPGGTNGTLPGGTNGTLPGGTNGTLPGGTNGTLPGGTNGTLPGGTNGTLPGGTNGTLPGGTNGTLPGGTNGTLPGGTNGTLPGVPPGNSSPLPVTPLQPQEVPKPMTPPPVHVDPPPYVPPPVYKPPPPPYVPPPVAPIRPPVPAPAPQVPSPPIVSPPRIQIPVVPMNPPLQLFPRSHR